MSAPGGIVGTLAASLLVVAVFSLATVIVLRAAWPWLRRALARIEPAARAGWLLSLAAAPVVVPLLLILLCFAPGLMGLVGLHADHCTAHAGHLHLCLVHPSVPLDVALVGVLVVTGVALACALATLARLLLASRRSASELRLAATDDLAPGVRRVESEQAFSFATGVSSGDVFVSSRLVEDLPGAWLQVVVAHEQAHAERRDGLRRLLARVLSLPLGRGLRRELLAAHELATEQACDEEAGRRVGDRLRVAEAILAVERLAAASAAGRRPLPAFGGSSVAARVEALLADPLPGPSRRVVWGVIGIVVGIAGGLALPLHHATEHGLERILRLL